MTPRQQTIIAAEILGHKRESKRFKMADGEIVTGYRWTCAHQGGGFHGWGFQQSKEAADSYVPMFHTDANASLMLAEWMADKKGLWLDCNRSLHGKWRSNFRPSPFGAVVADTLPLAVLGAFLKANGKEQP